MSGDASNQKEQAANQKKHAANQKKQTAPTRVWNELKRVLFDGDIPGFIYVVLLVCFLVTANMATTRSTEYGILLLTSLDAFLLGVVVGFLLASPPSQGEAGDKDSKNTGWASRLGNLGNWIIGGAFILLVTHFSDLKTSALNFLEALAAHAGPKAPDPTFTALLGITMAAAAAVGLAAGAFQMATTGRRELSRSARIAADDLAAKVDEIKPLVESLKTQLDTTTQAVRLATPESAGEGAARENGATLKPGQGLDRVNRTDDEAASG